VRPGLLATALSWATWRCQGGLEPLLGGMAGDVTGGGSDMGGNGGASAVYT